MSTFGTNLILILLLPYIIHGLPVLSELSNTSEVVASNPMTAFIGVIIGIGTVVCLVVTVVVCLCKCFSKPQEPAQIPQNGFPMSSTVSSTLNSADSREFTMFPPPGGSRYPVGVDDVYFEPLPDLRTLNQQGAPKGDRPRPVMFNHVAGRNLSFQDWFEDPYANFPRMRLKYVHEVGTGWFGQVVEGEATNIIPNEKKTKVVVKILMAGANTTDQMYFLHEVKPFRDTSHPNVLRLLGKCLESDPFLIILEHCIFDDLKKYLIKHRSESESLLKQNFLVRMVWNIASGLQYLHSCGFIITDLAARNCLVTADLVVKIGDYGNSFEKYKEEYYCAGGIAVPVRWCAPETLRCTDTIMETKEVTVEANVWSFGVVMWEVFEFAKLPYFELNDDDLIQKVIIEKSETLKRPLTPCRQMDHIYHLIRLCHLNAEKRPTMSSLCDMLEKVYSSDENGDPDDDFERRWNQLNSQTFHENSNSPSSMFSSLQLEDVPLSDLSLNFVDVTHSDENEESQTHSEDEAWKRIIESSKKESGEIIKMIQEKSQSVQDLMKLTVIDIESGSDSDAAGVSSEESLGDSITSKGNEVESGNIKSVSINSIPLSAPFVPDIVVYEASSTISSENSEIKNILSFKPSTSQSGFKFVYGAETIGGEENVTLSDNLGRSISKRRTSTPVKNENSFVVVDYDNESSNNVFFDPHMPSISTINNSTRLSSENDELNVNQSSYGIKYRTTNDREGLCYGGSLDEGLELSEDDSSYSLLTTDTNRSEEEDCILMVDLETNKAILVDAPSGSWEVHRNNAEEVTNDGDDQSNINRFVIEKIEDNKVEEKEIFEAAAADEVSDQLVIANSAILQGKGHEVEIMRSESPEWEASTESVSSICTSPSETSSSSSGEFDCSTTLTSDYLNSNGANKLARTENKEYQVYEDQSETIRLSIWDKDAIPTKSVLRSYNSFYLNEGKKNVSFFLPSESLIYEYPREPDLDEENNDDYFTNEYEDSFKYRPAWSYTYDDRFADYSTIADWDLGAEEMPEFEDVEDYEGEEEVDSSILRNVEPSSKSSRSTWGAMYTLSDMAYEEENNDDDENIAPTDDSLNNPPSFDLSAYFSQYNTNAYCPNGFESLDRDFNATPTPDENDEDFWLQRIIDTEDLIENVKCPFDLIDEDESNSDSNQDLETWNLNDTLGDTCKDNGLELTEKD